MKSATINTTIDVKLGTLCIVLIGCPYNGCDKTLTKIPAIVHVNRGGELPPLDIYE